jgi:glycosyltransferase involved in cell wall biosynthesis
VLVAPGDADAVADAIVRLRASTELRARLGAGARERVLEFTASRVVDQLEAIYRRVLPCRSEAVGRMASSG